MKHIVFCCVVLLEWHILARFEKQRNENFLFLLPLFFLSILSSLPFGHQAFFIFCSLKWSTRMELEDGEGDRRRRHTPQLLDKPDTVFFPDKYWKTTNGFGLWSVSGFPDKFKMNKARLCLSNSSYFIFFLDTDSMDLRRNSLPIRSMTI